MIFGGTGSVRGAHGTADRKTKRTGPKTQNTGRKNRNTDRNPQENQTRRICRNGWHFWGTLHAWLVSAARFFVACATCRTCVIMPPKSDVRTPRPRQWPPRVPQGVCRWDSWRVTSEGHRSLLLRSLRLLPERDLAKSMACETIVCSRDDVL